jgi:hypothetical protein
MAGTLYIVLYPKSDTDKYPDQAMYWTRCRILGIRQKVWIPHLDIFGSITTYYLRSYGEHTIRITTEDGQTSQYIHVHTRNVTGVDIQPRRDNHVEE